MSDSSADFDVINRYRDRFRRGPIGLWTTWLGAGWDIEYGCEFEFRLDGTGRAYSFDSGDDETPESESAFTWKLIEDLVIDIQPVGKSECESDWGIVRYDFAFSHSKYGGDRKLHMHEVRHHVNPPGFWRSPTPVVLSEENPQIIYVVANSQRPDEH